MFQRTQIKLTFFYSLLFLLLFWIFSFGLYEWMNNSFGEGYISQVQQRQDNDADTLFSKNTRVVTIAGDVALDELLRILVALNSVLLVVIPITSWFLAKYTLLPVKKSHEQQDQFVSDASHEMRTPLSIMTGEIEVALKKKRTAEEYRKTLISTKEETTRLFRLVENLLFLARTDKNNQAISFEKVDITDVLNEVVNALKPKSDNKHITITLQANEVISPTVSGNTSFLRQLFYNLLDNAITYTPHKGKITISLSEMKHTVSIAIQDAGIGITKDDLKKIIDRFYRVDASRSQTKGYGLGLAIVKAILAMHKGQLHISSEVGKGSIFTVVLPR